MSAARFTAIAALAATALFAAGNVIWAFDQPAPGSDARELIAFYEDASGRIVAGGLMSLTSIGLFTAFAAGLRSVLAEAAPDRPYADLAFGGALLGAAVGTGAEGINLMAAWRAADDELTASLALALFDISYFLGSYGAGVGFGLLMLGLGLAALRSGTLIPRWLSFAALVVGLALVTPLAGYLIGEYTVAPAFAIVVALGVRLLRGAPALASSGSAR